MNETTGRTDLAAAVKGTRHLSRQGSTISKMKNIVENKSAARVNGLLVDMFSASVYVAIYEALNEKNKAHLEAMPLQEALLLTFKLTK